MLKKQDDSRQKPLWEIALEMRNKKIIYFLYAVLLFNLVILIRLFFLQVSQGARFEKMGEHNFLRTEVIPARRGNVLDYENRLLATNRPVFNLHWYGSGSGQLTPQQRDFLNKVQVILGAEPVDIKYLERAEHFCRQVLLKEDLSQDELCKISEQCSESANLVIDRQFKRIYPYNNLASHILGYLRRAQDQDGFEGWYGLERHFHEDLKGEAGYVHHVTNATGRKLFQADSKDAVAGADLVLTLDLPLQMIAETLFEPGQSGAFVLMDPEDGSIRAFLSYPNFDPNLFLDPISEQEWNEKFGVDSPLLNRVIHAVYPPASIFKLITFVAGLEEGIITPSSKFVCPGYTLFCGRKYGCHQHWGHGLQTAKSALGFSCNIPCFQIAQKISIDQLAEYATRFGLGQSTNFLFHDKKGLIPTSVWKQTMCGERWYGGETLSVSVGQSFLLVTPLQILRMIASICSGHLVRPRMLVNEPVDRMPLCVSSHTLSFLKDAMREVVLEGTAQRLRRFSDFSIWAKTGTAQTISLQHQKKDAKRQLEHALLASFFSYKGAKPLAMVVLVENVGSSKVALQVAEKFFTLYRRLLRGGKDAFFGKDVVVTKDTVFSQDLVGKLMKDYTVSMTKPIPSAAAVELAENVTSEASKEVPSLLESLTSTDASVSGTPDEDIPDVSVPAEGEPIETVETNPGKKP